MESTVIILCLVVYFKSTYAFLADKHGSDNGLHEEDPFLVHEVEPNVNAAAIPGPYASYPTGDPAGIDFNLSKELQSLLDQAIDENKEAIVRVLNFLRILGTPPSKGNNNINPDITEITAIGDLILKLL